MSILETIKTPKGTLISIKSIALVSYLQHASGPRDLPTIANDTLVSPVTDAAMVDLHRRLRDLCDARHIHRLVVGDVLHWKAGPGPEEEDEEDAVPAVRNIAPPRRINVMAGRYVPERAPVMRPGADHRHLQSRGHRC